MPSHTLLLAWSLLTLAPAPRAGGVIPAPPVASHGWECVPGVVRGDGNETFRLEVEVPEGARSVRLTGLSPLLLGPGGDPVDLHDDGASPDVRAGDRVWTAGPFRFDASRRFPERFADDSSSPAGLSIARLGALRIESPAGAVSEFLLGPSVGLLHPEIRVAPVVQSAGDLVVSRHLINLMSADHETQRSLRSLGGDVARLTRRVYAALPDAFDFLFFFSADKLERTRRDAVENFTAGFHVTVRPSDAIGAAPLDDAARWGSAGRLLGVNLLDAYDRGIAGNNATHELLHQWSSQGAGPWSDACGHYRPESSAGSLLGGFRWSHRGNGVFSRDVDEGRNGARHAAPLDLYMMGLVDEAAVPPLRLAPEAAPFARDATVEAVRIATVEDLRALRGPRTTASPRRDFHLGFVIESKGRLLTPTERTFYDRLAEQYASTLPAESADPYVGSNWPTITRFFGHGTRWTSDIVEMSTSLSMREKAPTP